MIKISATKISRIIFYCSVVVWAGTLVLGIFSAIGNYFFLSDLLIAIGLAPVYAFPLYLISKGIDYSQSGLPAFYKAREIWILVLHAGLIILSLKLSPDGGGFGALVIMGLFGLGLVLTIVMRVTIWIFRRFRHA